MKKEWEPIGYYMEPKSRKKKKSNLTIENESITINSIPIHLDIKMNKFLLSQAYIKSWIKFVIYL